MPGGQHRGQRAAQVVTEDRQEGIARARELVGVARDRLRQRLVDRLVEAPEVVQRAVCSFDRCERHSLTTLDLNARYSEPSCSRLKPLRCRSAPCAVAAVPSTAESSACAPAGSRWISCAIACRIGFAWSRSANEAHRRRGRQQRARECVPFGDDFVHVLVDESGQRQRLGAPGQVQQAIELALDHRVALARALLEPRAVEHRDRAAAVADQPASCSLPAASVTPSRRTPSMFAISSWVIASSLRRQPVQAQQQPAAQLLLDRMMPVADRGLRHLRDQRLRVAQQQVLHRAAALELLLEQLRPAGGSHGRRSARRRGSAWSRRP